MKLKVFGKNKDKEKELTRKDVVIYQITELLKQIKEQPEDEVFTVTLDDGNKFRKLLSDILALLALK